MILLGSVQLKNFLSHKDTTIDFAQHKKVLLDGVSGSGKSSVIDAILWGLYGKSRTSNNRSLIHTGAKEASVEVELIQYGDNDITYIKIHRGVNTRGKHYLKVLESRPKNTNYKLVPTAGVKDTQDFIEQHILHASYTLFINSICYPQDNVESFVKQSAGNRKDLILEIIRAGDYDSYLKKSKEVYTSTKTEIGKIEVATATHERTITEESEEADKLPEYEKADTKFKDEIKDLDTARQMLSKENELEQVQRETLRHKEKDLSDINNELDLFPDQILKLQEQIDNLGKDDEDIFKAGEIEAEKKELARLKELKKVAEEWSKKYLPLLEEAPSEHNYDTDIDKINEQIIKIMEENQTFCPEIGRVCPTLEKQLQKSTAFLNEQLEQKQKQKQEQEVAVKAYNDKIKALGEQPKTPIDANETSIRQLEEKIIRSEKHDYLVETKRKSLEESITNYSADLKKAKESQTTIKKEIEDIKSKLSDRDIQHELSEMNAKYNATNMEYTQNLQQLTIAQQAKKRVDEAKAQFKALEKEKTSLEENLEHLELVVEAFGPNGVKAIVIDHVIPRLEDRINEVLSKLSDFRVELDTQKSGVKEETIIEGLFINIVNPQGEKLDFNNYSGGEKMRIIVAIAEGLADLSKHIGFRILDEAIVGLDQETAEGFSDVILDVEDRFEQLICISHLQNIKDMFEDKIHITKVNGVSTI